MGTVDLALEFLIALLTNASKIGQIIQTAQSQGRSQLTADEWAQVISGDDSAEQAVLDAIAKAKAAGN